MEKNRYMPLRDIQEAGSTDVVIMWIGGGRDRKKAMMASKVLVWVSEADMVSLSRRGLENRLEFSLIWGCLDI